VAIKKVSIKNSLNSSEVLHENVHKDTGSLRYFGLINALYVKMAGMANFYFVEG
jgi:hypothetical protein